MSLSFFEKIAEQKIRQAMENGEFDNNPLAGKPLPPDNLDKVPEELRMAYKILKNADILPEELQLRKDMVNLREMLDACVDEKEREEIRRKISEKQLRYNIIMEKRPNFSMNMQYHARIMEKLK